MCLIFFVLSLQNMQDIPINAEQKTLKDKIHCLVSVLPANTITLTDDDVISQMRAVRLKARDFGKFISMSWDMLLYVFYIL